MDQASTTSVIGQIIASLLVGQFVIKFCINAYYDFRELVNRREGRLEDRAFQREDA